MFHSKVHLKRPKDGFEPRREGEQHGQTPIKRWIRKKTRSKLSTKTQPGQLGWTRAILHGIRSNSAFQGWFVFYSFLSFIYFKYRFRCFSAMKKGKKVRKLREKAEIKQSEVHFPWQGTGGDKEGNGSKVALKRSLFQNGCCGIWSVTKGVIHIDTAPLPGKNVIQKGMSGRCDFPLPLLLCSLGLAPTGIPIPGSPSQPPLGSHCHPEGTTVPHSLPAPNRAKECSNSAALVPRFPSFPLGIAKVAASPWKHPSPCSTAWGWCPPAAWSPVSG